MTELDFITNIVFMKQLILDMWMLLDWNNFFHHLILSTEIQSFKPANKASQNAAAALW